VLVSINCMYLKPSILQLKANKIMDIMIQEFLENLDFYILFYNIYS